MRDAEHYVKVFVESTLTARDNAELAVLGPSIMGLMHDFRGEIPRGSDYKPETVAWRAERLRRLHPDYIRACELVMLLSEAEFDAAIEWAYHQDRRWPGYDYRIITRFAVAKHCGRDYGAWIKALERGHDRINAALGLIVA